MRQIAILSPVRLPFRHTGFYGKTLIAKGPKRKRELARDCLTAKNAESAEI